MTTGVKYDSWETVMASNLVTGVFFLVDFLLLFSSPSDTVGVALAQLNGFVVVFSPPEKIKQNVI